MHSTFEHTYLHIGLSRKTNINKSSLDYTILQRTSVTRVTAEPAQSLDPIDPSSLRFENVDLRVRAASIIRLFA